LHVLTHQIAVIEPRGDAPHALMARLARPLARSIGVFDQPLGQSAKRAARPDASNAARTTHAASREEYTAMDTISDYFRAERAESLLFIAVAALALLASLWCVLVLKKPFFNGLALSLSLVAALQLIVGVTVYLRSPQDTVRIQRMLQTTPALIHTEEVPRMNTVMRNFKLYLWAELALFLLSLLGLWLLPPATLLRGVAAGLALQALFTAVLDIAATARGDRYLQWLLTM
jgi:hypothetical protein